MPAWNYLALDAIVWSQSGFILGTSRNIQEFCRSLNKWFPRRRSISLWLFGSAICFAKYLQTSIYRKLFKESFYSNFFTQNNDSCTRYCISLNVVQAPLAPCAQYTYYTHNFFEACTVKVTYIETFPCFMCTLFYYSKHVLQMKTSNKTVVVFTRFVFIVISEIRVQYQ